MSVNDERLPTERFPAYAVRVHVVFEHGGLALAQPVHVDGRAKVAESFVGRHCRGFPNRSLGRFAVAHQHMNAMVPVVESSR